MSGQKPPPFDVFPIPRMRSKLASGLKIVNEAVVKSDDPIRFIQNVVATMFETMMEEGIDIREKQWDESKLVSVHDWSCMVVALAHYGGAEQPEQRIRDAVDIEVTIETSKSMGRSPSPLPPTPVRGRNVEAEKKQVAEDRRQDALLEYMKTQSSQREKNEEVTSSEDETETRSVNNMSKRPFKNKAVMWSPEVWGQYLTDDRSKMMWADQLKEMFVDNKELKSHPVLKGQAELMVRQFEQLMDVAISGGTVDHETTIDAAEALLTQLQSLTIHATYGKETADSYRDLKDMHAIPKAERMARKEAVRMTGAKPKMKENISQAQQRGQGKLGQERQDKREWIPPDIWKKMSPDERARSHRKGEKQN
jgi:hypothetical protein